MAKRRRRGYLIGYPLFGVFIVSAAYAKGPPSGVAALAFALAGGCALIGLLWGYSTACEERKDLGEAASFPEGGGLPILIDFAYDRFIGGGNGLGDHDLVLLRDLEATLREAVPGSPDFDARSQERLAHVIRKFYGIGAMGLPEIFDLVASLCHSLVSKGTHRPALELLSQLERKRAWLPYQKRMQAMVHEVGRGTSLERSSLRR